MLTDLVDAGNTGLGKQAALELAKHNPAHIFIASRSEEKARLAIAEIDSAAPESTTQLTPIALDLASFASVDAAAKDVLARTSRLDILMNNAGIMAVPAAVTVDGYEIQFGTNHMGHALLTKLLLPILLKTAQQPGSDVRIINLTSHSHQRTVEGGIQFDKLRTADPASSPLLLYGQSKLANILHAIQLAKRYSTIKTIAIHPGLVHTGLTTTMQNSFLLAKIAMPVVSWWHGVGVEQGVLNQLWGATSMEAQTGEYYEPVGKSGLGSPLTQDAELAEKLWAWTEDELADKGFGAQAKL
jgi:retinol dehydrogenase-12